MSKLKDLKAHPKSSLDIVTYISGTLPDGTKPKYAELFYRLLKKECENIVRTTEYGHYGIYVENPFYLLMDSGVKSIWDVDTLKKFVKFCKLNEDGLIEKNDITTYETFKEIIAEIGKAEDRMNEKILETYTHIIFEDDDWKILRPLSYESSLKYGANTKWCTASKSTRSSFDSYTKDGILIYCVSKTNKHKVACHKYLTGNQELTFWNVEDRRIDSLDTGLDIKYLTKIKDEINKNPKPNIDYLTKKKSDSDPLSTKPKRINWSQMVNERRPEWLGWEVTADDDDVDQMVDGIEYENEEQARERFREKLMDHASHLTNAKGEMFKKWANEKLFEENLPSIDPTTTAIKRRTSYWK